MSPEYIQQFNDILMRHKAQVLIAEFASQQFAALEKYSELETLEFMKKYEAIFVVWLDPIRECLEGFQVKGEPLTRTMMTNAIPVADEREAQHWKDLFAGTVEPRRTKRPRLVLVASNSEA